MQNRKQPTGFFQKGTPPNKGTPEQSIHIPWYEKYQQEKSEEMNKGLHEEEIKALVRLLIALAGFLICLFLLFWTIIISERKVRGTGHNFIRRAVMELNESPALQNIEATVDIDDLKGKLYYLTYGLYGKRLVWVFDEKMQRAHLDLGIIMKSKLTNAEYIGRINFSGRVLNWKSEDDENTSKYSKSEDPIFSSNAKNSVKDIMSKDGLILFVYESFLILSIMILMFHFLPGLVAYNFNARRYIKDIMAQKYGRLYTALVVYGLYSVFIRDILEVSPIITNLFSSTETLNDKFNLPHQSADLELENSTEIHYDTTDGFFIWVADRLNHYQNKSFEYRSRCHKWTIDSMILSVPDKENGGDDKLICIKKPVENSKS